MIAGSLKTVNYRNLSEVDFAPCKGVNVLYGDNAQGKTNLIEALFLFTGSRSFRGSKDSELVGFGSKFARVELDFFARGLDNKAAITINGGKNAELNGIKCDSVSELEGRFCAVVFSPDHLDLVKAGPAQRRKFVDGAIIEILPRYAAAMNEYRELLKQRNALLKDIPAHSELFDTLPVWDEKIARTGAYIVFTRMRYIRRLAPHAKKIYGGISQKPDKSGDDEAFLLEYEAEGIDNYPVNLDDSKTAVAQIKEKLETELFSQRAIDVDYGYTRCGPHRDDLKISIGGLDARIYGSQGQQRSAVLALKLSEASVLKEVIGEPPVLLLDDVMSELDRYRQNYILNSIGEGQVFITCCDPEGLGSLEGGRVFEVKKGAVTPV